MTTSPIDKYRALMHVMRTRFEMVALLRGSAGDRFLVAEACAFHGRKIVEAIAFGCLVALEHGLGEVPRDAKGKWNADAILLSLKKKNLGTAIPSPSVIRAATSDEQKMHAVTVTIDGQPDRRMTLDELRDAYTGLHRWNHEINPYVDDDRDRFLAKHEGSLWEALERLHRLMERHTISIRGRMYFTALKDTRDGQVKVIDLTNVREII